MKITRTAVGISILATFCLVAVLIVHAYSEFAYSSIYEKLETSDDPEVHDYIQTFLWAKSGILSSNPSFLFIPDFTKYQTGIYPSIFIVAVSFLILISHLESKLEKSIPSIDFNKYAKISMITHTIGVPTVLCLIWFWMAYFVFVIFNDMHLLTSWPDYIIVFVFSFVIFETIYMTYFFSYKIQIFRNLKESNRLSENEKFYEKIKTAIDLENKTWVQMIQIHIILYIVGMVGLFVSSYTQVLNQLPHSIGMLPEYGLTILGLISWFIVLFACMIIVMSLILRYLHNLTNVVIADD